ncbi:unnamed protein product [Acanthoscelides obtectus]|uniref:Uncharacterized protein n=1 Tax=Acanthoscelides obtectus TaxID=200917 RepID=A0A9P0K0A5_ACAOB|nr:unnamed protein product [Acanthoscelides obtectus]CAK1647198.1 hypothetical protein AOBTE_LOCUS15102 [Acanthoscelides obtectus]
MRQCMKCQVWYHEECVGLTESELIFEYPESKKNVPFVPIRKFCLGDNAQALKTFLN